VRHFDDRVVIVTGGGRGLGRSHALLLARLGATVVVNDAGVAPDGTGGDEGPARSVAEAIKSAGGASDWSTTDVSSRAACAELIDRTVARFGRLDALVHSAGIVDRTPIDEIEETVLARTLAINVEAAVWLCQAAIRAMRPRRYGRIVLTTSGHGLLPTDPPAIPAYSIGKAAQFGLMNELALACAADGILINTIAPVAATRMYTGPDPERLGPEHVSPGVAFLASDWCRSTGLVLRAAGGEFSIGGYAATSGARFEEPATSLEGFVDRWPAIIAGDYEAIHRASDQ
jgi:NAD(P)-dependent dehydrogenase (short-subunit alcohol dehydrogenase family)